MNIPNFIDVPFVNKDGTLTDQWRNILQVLIQSLQQNASNEGLVVPSQTTTNLTIIQNHTVTNGSNTSYTTQYGTLLYDLTANTLKIALNNGSNVPEFKTITTS